MKRKNNKIFELIRANRMHHSEETEESHKRWKRLKTAINHSNENTSDLYLFEVIECTRTKRLAELSPLLGTPIEA
jgi:hypothetical protein